MNLHKVPLIFLEFSLGQKLENIAVQPYLHTLVLMVLYVWAD